MSTPQGSRRRIVVGVDGSDPAARAVRWALEEARCRGATVRVVHAWQYPNLGADVGFPLPESVIKDVETAARETLDRAIEDASLDGVELERSLVMGPAAPALLEAADDADLLVVGSRGRGGFAGLLLGSVSQQCVHHATCPVVVVPAVEHGHD